MLYGLVMMTIGRKLTAPFESHFQKTGKLSADSYTLVITLLMLCALITDEIGIYAVFGAFICGAALPRGGFSESGGRTHRTPDDRALLLPMFFTYSGLNTRIDLVNTVELG